MYSGIRITVVEPPSLAMSYKIATISGFKVFLLLEVICMSKSIVPLCVNLIA